MIKKLGILFLTGMLFFTSKVYSQDPNFYIFLCFGQSNMEGAARPEEQDKIVDSSFMVLESVDCPDLGRTKEAGIRPFHLYADAKQAFLLLIILAEH